MTLVVVAGVVVVVAMEELLQSECLVLELVEILDPELLRESAHVPDRDLVRVPDRDPSHLLGSAAVRLSE